MADLNYISPSGMMPNLQQAPGGLAGMLMGQQMNDYRNTMDLQQLVSSMNAMKTGNELQEYMANAPVRERTRRNTIQKSDLDYETAPQLSRLTVQDKEQDVKKNRLANQLTEGTLSTAIAAGNAKNQGTISAQDENTWNNAVEALGVLKYGLENDGPLALQNFFQQVETMGMPKTLKNFILGAKTPEEAAKRIDYAMKNAVGNIKTLQNKEILGIKEAGLDRRANLSAETQRYAAKLKAYAQRDAAQIRADVEAGKITRESLPQMFARLQQSEITRAVAAGVPREEAEAAVAGYIADVMMYATDVRGDPNRRLEAILKGQTIPTPANTPQPPKLVPPPKPGKAPTAPPPGSNVLEFDAQGNPINSQVPR